MTLVPREVTDRQRAQNMRTPQIVVRLNEIEERPGRVRTEAPARVHEEWRALIDELRTRHEEAAAKRHQRGQARALDNRGSIEIFATDRGRRKSTCPKSTHTTGRSSFSGV